MVFCCGYSGIIIFNVSLIFNSWGCKMRIIMVLFLMICSIPSLVFADVIEDGVVVTPPYFGKDENDYDFRVAEGDTRAIKMLMDGGKLSREDAKKTVRYASKTKRPLLIIILSFFGGFDSGVSLGHLNGNNMGKKFSEEFRECGVDSSSGNYSFTLRIESNICIADKIIDRLVKENNGDMEMAILEYTGPRGGFRYDDYFKTLDKVYRAWTGGSLE